MSTEEQAEHISTKPNSPWNQRKQSTNPQKKQVKNSGQQSSKTGTTQSNKPFPQVSQRKTKPFPGPIPARSTLSSNSTTPVKKSKTYCFTGCNGAAAHSTSTSAGMNSTSHTNSSPVTTQSTSWKTSKPSLNTSDNRPNLPPFPCSRFTRCRSVGCRRARPSEA